MSPTARSAKQLIAELKPSERHNALSEWIAQSYSSTGSSLKRDSDMMDEHTNESMKGRPKKAKTVLSADSSSQDARDMRMRWDALKKQHQSQPDDDEKMSGEQEKGHVRTSVRGHIHSSKPDRFSKLVIDARPSRTADLAMTDEYWIELKKQHVQEVKAYPEEEEEDHQDQDMLDEDNEHGIERIYDPARLPPIDGPHDMECDWDEMAQALQSTGHPLAAAKLTRLNEKARSPDADDNVEEPPRNKLCEDFVAALSNLEGRTGLHGRQFAGLRRMRKIKIIIEDFGGSGEDEETKDLEEADEEWAYVATMEE